jgi:hypothetical protein
MQHPGRVIIRGVTGATGDFQDTIPAGQRLADIRAVAGMRGC